MSQTTGDLRISHESPVTAAHQSHIELDMSPENIELPASPQLAPADRVTSGELEAESANTDSMVTIRLSGIPAASRKSVNFSPLTATPSQEESNASRHDSALSLASPTSAEGEEEKVEEQQEASVTATSTELEVTTEALGDEQKSSSSRPGSGSLASLKANTMSTATAATVDDFEGAGLELKRVSSRSSLASSTGSVSSNDSANHVDWEQLDKNEEAEVRDQATDESTAFLLARLERENQLLSQDPKAQQQVNKARIRGQSRPPSLQQIKKMANESSKTALRYSLLPNPPPMTELEFWSALVRDYAQTAQRLPTLTSNKIRSGIPPPLRGVVWVSIAGARDPHLEEEYERLCGESSPYEKLIGKDIGRSFPGVDMFRDPDGDGQKMLGKVLNAYSLWDDEIGYCQGLGFVVGPLIMHMSDKDAFCVLVKLMQSYDLRNCFLPDLSGLKMRIFQFQNLLRQHLPTLTEHLDHLKVEPLYVSQWFLSFFGVNCPLPMLIRIYDILLTEGASETLMRVALSLMRRNEEKILALTEFEDVMGLLLSRALWDTYNCQADDLVNDFVGWTGLVTRDGLHDLETKFKEQSTETSEGKNSQKVESAAARFLGRFWASSSPTTSPTSKSSIASPTLATPTQNETILKRTPSKQSMASTLNSIESTESTQSLSTAATDSTRLESGEFSAKPSHTPKPSMSLRSPTVNRDRDLHSQIEDLLMAMNDLQREQAMLANDLQREREDRDEDRAVVARAVEKLRKRKTLEPVPEEDKQSNADDSDDTVTEDPVTELENHFGNTKTKRSSLTLQTKLQLRDEVNRWKTQYNEEVTRSTSLSTQLTEKEREAKEVRDQLRDARSRIADSHRDMQRLEKTNRDLRDKGGSHTFNSPRASIHSIISNESASTPKASGLRELKLGRAATNVPAVSTTTSPPPAVFNRRVSSLSMQNVLATEDNKPLDQEALLLELVNAKTAEAVAKQELEEVRGKLDALRKMMSSNAAAAAAAAGGSAAPGHSAGSLSVSNAIGLMRPADDKKKEEKAEDKKPAAPVSSGGWFSGGWGKRAVSGTGS